MILKILAVYDSKAEVFSRPFFAVALGAALRSFEDAVNDPKSEYSAHPGDYTLFAIGEYDDKTGLCSVGDKGVVNLGVGVQFVRGAGDPMQLRLG